MTSRKQSLSASSLPADELDSTDVLRALLLAWAVCMHQCCACGACTQSTAAVLSMTACSSTFGYACTAVGDSRPVLEQVLGRFLFFA